MHQSQFERIRAVFNTQEAPSVAGETLHRYFDYLKENLVCPCLLTGIESLGHFGWEERFLFGCGDKKEYKRLRQERGSYQDKYVCLPQTLAYLFVWGKYAKLWWAEPALTPPPLPNRTW